MGIVVYTTSVPANASIRNQIWQVCEFLRLNKIEFEEIDLSVHTDARPIMLKKIPEKFRENAFPPQIFNDEDYCGNYDSFFNANEMGVLYTFFKLSPPEGSREETLVSKYKSQGIQLQF